MLLFYILIAVGSTPSRKRFVIVVPKVETNGTESHTRIHKYKLYRAILQIHYELVFKMIENSTFLTLKELSVETHKKYKALFGEYLSQFIAGYLQNEQLTKKERRMVRSFEVCFLETLAFCFQDEKLYSRTVNDKVIKKKIVTNDKNLQFSVQTRMYLLMVMQQFVEDLMEKNMKERILEVLLVNFIDKLSKDTTFMIWHNEQVTNSDLKFELIPFNVDITYVESSNFFDDITRLLAGRKCNGKAKGSSIYYENHIHIDMGRFIMHFIEEINMALTNKVKFAIAHKNFLMKMIVFLYLDDKYIMRLYSCLPTIGITQIWDYSLNIAIEELCFTYMKKDKNGGNYSAARAISCICDRYVDLFNLKISFVSEFKKKIIKKNGIDGVSVENVTLIDLFNCIDDYNIKKGTIKTNLIYHNQNTLDERDPQWAIIKDINVFGYFQKNKFMHEKLSMMCKFFNPEEIDKLSKQSEELNISKLN